MKVLSLFLLLSAAVAKAQKDISSNSPASTVEDSVASPLDTAIAFAPPKLSQEVHSAEPSGSYEPLFNFDLEPYNMALEIVADALEKLSDTMEPLDLPLPLVGPGYYLEVQVKSPKNAHGSVPFSQINAVTIEGGQAPPVTQVEIILPGESVAHETFMLPVDSVSESATLTAAIDSEMLLSSATHDASSVASISVTEDQTEMSGTISPSVASATMSPTPPAKEHLTAKRQRQTIRWGHLGGLGSIFAGAYGSSVALQEQSLSISVSAGFSFSGGVSELVPSASADVLPTAGVSMPVSVIPSALSAASPSDAPLDEAASSVPSQPPLVPTMTDPLIASSEPVPVALSSSMFPLDVAQVHSQKTSVSAAPLASVLEAGLSAVPTTKIPSLSSSVGNASVLTFSEEDVDEESVTMATAPLPFPPFGGPQHQQEPSLSNESAGEAAELVALPTLSSGGLMETIDIISASNDNALESSIDAILHSVIQDYRTELIPKAAVGFALIHPRRQAAVNNARY
ncbi:hypothetical protein IW152_004370 [Coemansia sp. BCRC 34962]|nr:hypothetical protein IW152_004370 [Coemansia sp. BCRC 34962]